MEEERDASPTGPAPTAPDTAAPATADPEPSTADAGHPAETMESNQENVNSAPPAGDSGHNADTTAEGDNVALPTAPQSSDDTPPPPPPPPGAAVTEVAGAPIELSSFKGKDGGKKGFKGYKGFKGGFKGKGGKPGFSPYPSHSMSPLAGKGIMQGGGVKGGGGMGGGGFRGSFQTPEQQYEERVGNPYKISLMDPPLELMQEPADLAGLFEGLPILRAEDFLEEQKTQKERKLKYRQLENKRVLEAERKKFAEMTAIEREEQQAKFRERDDPKARDARRNNHSRADSSPQKRTTRETARSPAKASDSEVA